MRYYEMHNPLHPGEIVKEVCIEGADLSITEASKRLGVDRTTFSRFIHGHINLSAEMAARLAKATNTSIASWLNLQRDYDQWRAEQLCDKIHVSSIAA
jgi:antitoxin HigA-1